MSKDDRMRKVFEHDLIEELDFNKISLRGAVDHLARHARRDCKVGRDIKNLVT